MTTDTSLWALDGRVALVTGAAGHVGRAVVAALEAHGCTVAGSDRDRAEFPCDLGDEAQVRSLVPAVLGRHGRLDVLINCGAMVSAENQHGWTSPFEAQEAATWRRALEANLTAPFLLAQAAAPALNAAEGAIINVGSIYGMLGPDMRLYDGTPMGNAAAYAAGKGGLLQLTRWLSTVLAPRVRVNMITLGGIERGQPPAFVERYAARTPLGRMGAEADMVGAFVFLAGSASRYVTGQNLVVDGGFSAW